MYGLNNHFADNDWVFNRCREVQAAPNGHLDLWAREHFKSTIITFALTIQDILNNPNVTIGIFSHTRPIAKGFLRQIKREFEANEQLKEWFPDVLWKNPQKDAPKWSEDDGIIVQRSDNSKESTVEAWGLVDGQPTSKHFGVLLYDDVVTRESITSPEMIKKTTDAWELSDNLGREGGAFRIVGTRYHFNDTYGTILSRNVAAPRIYPCTVDGTEEGEPVLMKRETLDEKRRKQGPYTFGTQMLLNPKGDNKQGFNESWLKYSDKIKREGLNVYIVCDPASEKKKTSDYTCFWVIGCGPDEKYRVLDIVHDRLNLTERTQTLFRLHRKYRPIAVGYEKYGKDADIQHIQSEMNRVNYEFHITELGGRTSKNDRIRRLIPIFEQGRIIFPVSKPYTNWEGETVDLVEIFRELEYKAFPVAVHDDMLDALARMEDPDFPVTWPDPSHEEFMDEFKHDNYGGEGSWLGA